MNDASGAGSNRWVEVRRTIPATAERLWSAWLDANSFATWMVPPGIRSSHARTDARVGGAYEITMHGTGDALQHSGVYREIDRPRRLVLTWISGGTHFMESVVTAEFHQRAVDTEVVVTHAGLPDAAAAQSHEDGWTEVLAKLEAFASGDR